MNQETHDWITKVVKEFLDDGEPFTETDVINSITLETAGKDISHAKLLMLRDLFADVVTQYYKPSTGHH